MFNEIQVYQTQEEARLEYIMRLPAGPRREAAKNLSLKQLEQIVKKRYQYTPDHDAQILAGFQKHGVGKYSKIVADPEFDLLKDRPQGSVRQRVRTLENQMKRNAPLSGDEFDDLLTISTVDTPEQPSPTEVFNISHDAESSLPLSRMPLMQYTEEEPFPTEEFQASDEPVNSPPQTPCPEQPSPTEVASDEAIASLLLSKSKRAQQKYDKRRRKADRKRLLKMNQTNKGAEQGSIKRRRVSNNVK